MLKFGGKRVCSLWRWRRESQTAAAGLLSRNAINRAEVEAEEASSSVSAPGGGIGLFRGFASEPLASTYDMGMISETLPSVAAVKNPTSRIVYNDHNHERYPPGDPSKRAFAYFVLTGGRFVYASLIRLLILKFVLSMSASKDVLAMASLEVDLSSIEPGSTVTVKWRGKPVFIRR